MYWMNFGWVRSLVENTVYFIVLNMWVIKRYMVQLPFGSIFLTIFGKGSQEHRYRHWNYVLDEFWVGS
jgi:hypothetical protein